MTILKTHHFDGTAGQSVAYATEGFDTVYGTPPVYQAGGITNTCARFTVDTVEDDLTDTTSVAPFLGFYLRVPAAPATNTARIMGCTSGANSYVAYLIVNSDLTLSIASPWSAVATTTSPLTANTWYRIAWHIDLPGSTQELRLADAGGVAIQTLTGACRPNGQTVLNSVRCGSLADASGSGLVFDLDEYVIADDWPYTPPPATGPTVRGVIQGGVEVPATVRGVIQGGVEVPATVASVIGGTAPAPNVITFSDFAGGNYVGLNYLNTGTSIIGDGVDQTTYEMVPNSSTQGSYVAGLTSGQTNQCTLVKVGNNDGSFPTGLEFSGFTLQGTDQGHIYNGMTVGYSSGANVHDIKILDVPGNDVAPPGETFSLSMWHANNSTLSNVTIDGGGVAATLLGFNTVDTATVTNCTFSNSGYAMSVACWESKNITFENCVFDGANRGLNIENPYGGYHHFKGCTFENFGYNYQVNIQGGVWVAPNGSTVSTVLTIEDPVWDFAARGPFAVRHFPKASYPSNVQLDSDIHLVINGVDVTSDPTKFKFVTP